MMSSYKNFSRGFFFILLLVFLSRLPFIHAGYGGEEDAWGLALTARQIAASGQYEVSRLPGHPLQEFVYAAISHYPAWVFNLITALFSVVATGFFMRILMGMSMESWMPAGIAFAFTPVVYINSCNAMDYLWTQALVLVALYLLQRGQPLWTGFFLGLASGCRITALAMLLPFAFLLYDKINKRTFLTNMAGMVTVALIVFAVLYTPAYLRYGFSFFDYTARIPAPIDKAIYRATIGTWGVIGFIDLLTLILAAGMFKKSPLMFKENRTGNKKMIAFCWLVILIYLIAYILLPQKAAFLIPIIPFVILLICQLFPPRVMTAFSFSMVLSSFFISINLASAERAATPSRWSISTTLGSRQVVIDFLHGPIMAEHSKRINKMSFARQTAEKIVRLDHPSVIIAGFWYNDVMFPIDTLPAHVKIVYYMPEDSLKTWKEAGKAIYFLPEQDAYNDLCYRGRFTTRYARLLP
jgi:hypothetical protein